MAASPGRAGNRQRRQLLLDSRNEPWSAAERRFHQMLRAAGITGWQTNYLIVIAGRRYFGDVVFPDLRLVIEIDGREHHGAEAFESVRWRQNALVLDGYRVLRFTWAMLVGEPDEVIADVQSAIAG